MGASQIPARKPICFRYADTRDGSASRSTCERGREDIPPLFGLLAAARGKQILQARTCGIDVLVYSDV